MTVGWRRLITEAAGVGEKQRRLIPNHQPWLNDQNTQKSVGKVYSVAHIYIVDTIPTWL